MPYYRSVGEIPRKRHVQFRQPDGSLYAEELMGEEGFSFDSALLYHKNIPTGLKAIETVEAEDQEQSPNHPLKPRHFKTHQLKAGGNAVMARALLMGNEDCAISYFVGSDDSDLYKNATGDEMVYIEQGTGVLETVFGAIAFGPGDYLIIPASVIHRYALDESSEPMRALILETRGHIGPDRKSTRLNSSHTDISRMPSSA